jgi:hypothetical protein
MSPNSKHYHLGLTLSWMFHKHFVLINKNYYAEKRTCWMLTIMFPETSWIIVITKKFYFRWITYIQINKCWLLDIHSTWQIMNQLCGSICRIHENCINHVQESDLALYLVMWKQNHCCNNLYFYKIILLPYFHFSKNWCKKGDGFKRSSN